MIAVPPFFVFVAETGIVLNLATELDSGIYHVVLRVSDTQGVQQENTVKATVCDCTGNDVQCQEIRIGGTNLPVILGILGGILLLLSKSDIWFQFNIKRCFSWIWAPWLWIITWMPKRSHKLCITNMVDPVIYFSNILAEQNKNLI